MSFSCPLLRSCFIGSCHADVSKSLTSSISLAVCCLSLCIFWLIRSLVDPSLATFIAWGPTSRPKQKYKNQHQLKEKFYLLGKIQPRDLKLSDVMATSAAALALYMGVYDVMTETVRNLQMVLGVHFGKSLISDPSRDVAGTTISCCRVRSILLLSPLRQSYGQV